MIFQKCVKWKIFGLKMKAGKAANHERVLKCVGCLEIQLRYIGYNLTKPLFQDDYNVLKNLLITICNAHIAICKSEPYYRRIEGKDKSEYQW